MCSRMEIKNEGRNIENWEWRRAWNYDTMLNGWPRFSETFLILLFPQVPS